MKLSAITKRTPIELETSEGEVKLYVSEMTFADGERQAELLKPYFTEKGEVKPNTSMRVFTVARVMSALKYEKTGDYYFGQKTVEQCMAETSGMPFELMNQLNDVVTELNPYPTEDNTLDAKKKSS